MVPREADVATAGSGDTPAKIGGQSGIPRDRGRRRGSNERLVLKAEELPLGHRKSAQAREKHLDCGAPPLLY
jgi:hypothetical protein